MEKSPKNPKRLKSLRSRKIIPIIVSSVLVASIIPIGIFLINTQLNTQLEGYIFKDSLNREVTVPYHPKRIISLSPSVTEFLYALEVDDRLVGVTSYCNYPIDALDKADVGGFTTPNMEVILGLNPDLIISSYSAWPEEDISKFDDLSLPLVIIFANTLDEVIEQAGIIGNLTKVGSKGTELKNKLMNDMKFITDKTSKIDQSDILDCYFEVWESPMVAGGKSYIDDMIQKAGAINIFHSLEYEYHTVSHESVILGDPDVIFITEHSAPWYSQEISDRPGYNVISACVNNRIYQCFDDVYLRTGPRIMIALENMTRYLYPSLFIEDGQLAAEFNVNQTTIIEGESIEFSFTGSEGNGPATFYWDFGDGQHSKEQDPIHVYANFGLYDISLTIIDANGDSNIRSNFYILVLWNFSFWDYVNLCINQL